MIINCLLPGVLEMGVVLVGVVYVPTFHFKKLATMLFVGRTVQNIQDKVKNLMKRKQKK